MPETLLIPAFAKLNLVLAVSTPEPAATRDGAVNPRAGWHRISSLFSCIDLADELALTPLSSGLSRFSVRWAGDAPAPSQIDWPIEADLMVRAHAMAEAQFGREFPVEAVLTKRIPVGGGMGGGSSDGAAMLRGLASLFSLSTASLTPIASKLGSDVSFFLDSAADVSEPARPAIVEGFGERIRRRTPVRSDIILICPRISCPTPAVYRAFDRWLAGQPAFRFREAETLAIFESDALPSSPSLFNDLAEPAFAVAPELREIHAAASRILSPFHVTGSGSALFALAPAAAVPGAVAALRADLASKATVLATTLR